MLYELQPADYLKVSDLFVPMGHHLAITSILMGDSPAAVYADHPGSPTAAFTVYRRRLYLAGSPPSPGLISGLHDLLVEKVLPQARAAGLDPLLLFVDREAWESQLDAIFPGGPPLGSQRSYFECTAQPEAAAPSLPDGFRLQRLEPGLLSHSGLGRLDELREELVSERSSEEEFFEKSFGFVVLKGEELAAWCLSEYNTGDRCEVGVATAQPYQGLGLGTAVTRALVEHALGNGYRRIGWHCWKGNEASAALARRAGFEHRRDDPAYLYTQDPGAQLGYHGNRRRAAGEWAEALQWYEQARLQEDAPAWVYYNAARCYARMGDEKLAFQRLREAIARGYVDYEHLRSDPDLDSLPRDAEWEALFKIHDPSWEKRGQRKMDE